MLTTDTDSELEDSIRHRQRAGGAHVSIKVENSELNGDSEHEEDEVEEKTRPPRGKRSMLDSEEKSPRGRSRRNSGPSEVRAHQPRRRGRQADLLVANPSPKQLKVRNIDKQIRGRQKNLF